MNEKTCWEFEVIYKGHRKWSRLPMYTANLETAKGIYDKEVASKRYDAVRLIEIKSIEKVIERYKS